MAVSALEGACCCLELLQPASGMHMAVRELECTVSRFLRNIFCYLGSALAVIIQTSMVFPRNGVFIASLGKGARVRCGARLLAQGAAAGSLRQCASVGVLLLLLRGVCSRLRLPVPLWRLDAGAVAGCSCIDARAVSQPKLARELHPER